jgi:hypothetical protein
MMMGAALPVRDNMVGSVLEFLPSAWRSVGIVRSLPVKSVMMEEPQPAMAVMLHVKSNPDTHV